MKFRIETKPKCDWGYWTERETVEVVDGGSNIEAAREMAMDWGVETYPGLDVYAQAVPNYWIADITI